jgi:tRNA uridine 5-carbamoylmethylation protein Kti12
MLMARVGERRCLTLGCVTSGAAIVHLIGYPGTGKYTIARQLDRVATLDGRRFVVVDNHHTSNVIFAVLEVDGVRPVAREVWDRVGEVREALYRTIEEMSPPEWSFVFTNVLSDGDPTDEAIVRRVAQLASRRGNPYVPVRVVCAPDEILRRVPNPDRQQRMKWIDAGAVRAFMDEHELVNLDQQLALEVDVTTGSAEDAAQRIFAHVRSLD